MSQENGNQLLDSEFLHRIERLTLINKTAKKGQYSGKRKSKQQGSSIEFADYRSYTPGDDFRQIDWNAFARHEKLFLKTFFDEQELHISIYLDISKSMDFGSPKKIEKAIQIAAALGYISLHNFDRLSIYSFDNKINSKLLSIMGKGKTHQLFSFLNTLKVAEEGSLNQALAAGKATLGKPGISFIISDFLFEDGYEKGINFIHAANQEVVLIQILYDEERDPLIEGDIRLIDSETKHNKELTVTSYLLDEYKKMLKDYNDSLIKYAFNRGMSFLSVNSETEIEQVIFKIFKNSGLIR